VILRRYCHRHEVSNIGYKILTLRLTPWMNISPGSNSCSASQEISRFIASPKVRYQGHRNSKHVLIMRQTNPIKTSHYITAGCILILYSHLRIGLPSDSFLQGFCTKILYAFLLSPYVPRSSSLSLSPF